MEGPVAMAAVGYCGVVDGHEGGEEGAEVVEVVAP